MQETIHIDICPICNSPEIKTMLTCKDNFATGEEFNIYKCGQCGFAFTQDFPSEKEIGRYYESPDYISHTDTDKGIINSLYHQARKIALKSKSKIILKYAAVKTGSLLDIGCGTGYFLDRMRHLKWIITGIEQSESVRKTAKEKFDIDVQDSEYLFQIQEKRKDVLTMWHVLEHMEHLDKVVSQLHNILKDDGIIAIALPNKDSYDAAHYKKDWAAYDVPRHLWHFSPLDFEQLANKHKFDVVAIKPMYFDAFYISMLSEKNKGTFLGSIIGLMKGWIFFIRSLANTKRCSSLVYILKKQK